MKSSCKTFIFGTFLMLCCLSLIAQSGIVDTAIRKNDASQPATISFFIKKYVELKINEWQEKGEFETTSDYQARVSEENRNNKIEQYKNEVLTKLKNRRAKAIEWKSFTLESYDADNQSFLVRGDSGEYSIRVPLKDAKLFKQSWENMSFSNPDFYMDKNDHLKLSAFTITEPYTYNFFRYDDKDAPNYLNTKITYNFKPIDANDMGIGNREGSAKVNKKGITLDLTNVDVNIPKTGKSNPHGYALIIGNEDYSSFQTGLSSESNVDFAVNDAQVFKDYCINSFGIPESNIRLCKNATAGTINQNIDWLNKIIKIEGGDAEVVVYYSGHGLPDEQTKDAYMVPVDVSAANIQYAIRLNSLYSRLTESRTQKVTVFLDACFSGGARNSGLLASKGIVIKPKADLLKGKIVVFTSSSGTQSSLSIKEGHHGIFTYYLLKKLQETKGDISYEEMYGYLKKEVDLNCVKVNNKEQTPDLMYADELGDSWKGWRF